MATRALPEDYVAPTYEGDLAAWAHHQAMLLRSGQLHLLDRARIAEELDDVGSEQYDRWESALRLVMTHMLKWDYQPSRRSRSWVISIATHRRHAHRQVKKNPSFQSRQSEVSGEAYEDARSQAAIETDLPLKAFPVACPYSWDDIMNRSFDWPEDDE
jgi:hypothetical protein